MNYYYDNRENKVIQYGYEVIGDNNIFMKDGVATALYEAITKAQYDFALANRQASKSEIIALALTPPTAEQLFKEAKESKMNELKAWLGGQLASGFTYDGSVYDLTERKMLRINAQFGGFDAELKTGVLEADLGEALLTDRDSIQHSFTYAEYPSFVVAYRDRFLSVFGTYSAKENLITLATNDADLTAIIIE